MSAVPGLAALRGVHDFRVQVRPSSRVLLRNAAALVAGGIFVGAVLVYSPRRLDDPHLFTGIAIALVSIGVAFAVPWDRLPDAASAAVPLLHLLALGVLASGGLPVALLAAFPVLSLARFHGLRGALVGAVGGIAVAWAPVFASPAPLLPGDVPRMLLLPIVLLTVAVTVAEVERSARARSRLLERQDADLQQLLGELVVERELLEGILAVLPAGVLVLDDDGRVVLVNPRWERLTGGLVPQPTPRTEPSSSGPSPESCLLPVSRHEDDPRARLAALVDRALAGETVVGETHWWHDPGGQGNALRQSTVQLPRRPEQRALSVVLLEDLTQEELAIEQREDFVRAVSHELRNPLTSVVGYMELAREGDGVTPDTHELLDVAGRNAHRVLDLVDGLLTAASLRAGRLAIELAPTDLAVVVTEAVDQARFAAFSAGITIEHGDLGSREVRGDRARLLQAVAAVLSNAVTYSDPGGRVTLVLGVVGEHVVLEVTDRGIGMCEEDRLRVFERFFRSPALLGGSRHGTVLGLHVAGEVVRAHGGEILVHSVLGEGTRVRIVLPLGSSQEPGR